MTWTKVFTIKYHRIILSYFNALQDSLHTVQILVINDVSHRIQEIFFSHFYRYEHLYAVA